MPYTQLFYHVVWATKNREPVLTPQIEQVIHDLLRAKAINLGAAVFALNGWVDHIHLIATIPSSISVAKFIGQVKAVASTKFNKSGHPQAPLYWQAEYAVFSFDKKRLPNHVEYVERQKEHHARRTCISVLEQTGEESIMAVHELSSEYFVRATDWEP